MKAGTSLKRMYQTSELWYRESKDLCTLASYGWLVVERDKRLYGGAKQIGRGLRLTVRPASWDSSQT